MKCPFCDQAMANHVKLYMHLVHRHADRTLAMEITRRATIGAFMEMQANGYGTDVYPSCCEIAIEMIHDDLNGVKHGPG